MEESLILDGTPSSASFEKPQVLDVRPLRCLFPVFTFPLGFTNVISTSQAATPFSYVAPYGTYPHGLSLFYSPVIPLDPQMLSHPPPDATNQTILLQPSYGTPVYSIPSRFVAPPNARSHRNMSRCHERGSESHKRFKSVREDEFLSQAKQEMKEPKMGEGNIIMTFDAFQRADGNRQTVEYILVTFDALRRRITQTDDAKIAVPGVTRRPDLRAGTIMMNRGLRTNSKKRIGMVPGIEVGDIFFFRMEMSLVGLHAPCMAGIDYTTLMVNQDEDNIAVSLVSSGSCEGDGDAEDVLIYSGQNGNKQLVGQKPERGNLALERSLHRSNEVRVIRGTKDPWSPTGKIYIYDGLYKIKESWCEKGRSGGNTFKFKLVREPGQPIAFALWKSIQQWKDDTVSRVGLILTDLALGVENLPVSLVNDVDNEKGPSNFTYIPKLKGSKPYKPVNRSFGCSCYPSCLPGDSNCTCLRKNGGDLPYAAAGILVTKKPLIHECGQLCPCYSSCQNRVSQTGLKVRLEVFKTKDKGWGLRSWDPIRAGTFICEYAGEVIEKTEVEEAEDDGNEYIFDTTRIYDDSFQWNYAPELLGEDIPGDRKESSKPPLSLIISSRNCGNVARFMNHSCSPNVFWQPVLFQHDNESHLHVAFFAIKHIPPMTELTYNYGKSEQGNSEVQNSFAYNSKKKCLCRSPYCSGFFG